MNEIEDSPVKNRKFLIVDGSSLLSTCYYGVLPREIMFAKTEEEKRKHYDKILRSKDGTYTNAVYGMIKAVAGIIKKQTPDHIAFVFDKTRDTFRRELYPAYKGNRTETPEPLIEQFVLIEKILEDVGFQVLYGDQYEADDYAGSLVYKFRGEIPIVLMTKDHDYLQLVNDFYNVRAWMVMTKPEKAAEMYEKYYKPFGIGKEELNLPEKVVEFTSAHVYAEEGVWPEQIMDLKAIQGDSSDNIPGVKGVSSAAAPLLEEYRTVQEIYSAIHEAEQDKALLKDLQEFWKNSLGISRSPLKSLVKPSEEGQICGEEAALLSKELATIKTNIEIDRQLSDFSLDFYQEEKLRAWCRKLDIKEKAVFGAKIS